MPESFKDKFTAATRRGTELSSRLIEAERYIESLEIYLSSLSISLANDVSRLVELVPAIDYQYRPTDALPTNIAELDYATFPGRLSQHLSFLGVAVSFYTDERSEMRSTPVATANLPVQKARLKLDFPPPAAPYRRDRSRRKGVIVTTSSDMKRRAEELGSEEAAAQEFENERSLGISDWGDVFVRDIGRTIDPLSLNNLQRPDGNPSIFDPKIEERNVRAIAAREAQIAANAVEKKRADMLKEQRQSALHAERKSVAALWESKAIKLPSPMPVLNLALDDVEDDVAGYNRDVVLAAFAVAYKRQATAEDETFIETYLANPAPLEALWSAKSRSTTSRVPTTISSLNVPYRGPYVQGIKRATGSGSVSEKAN